MATDTTVTPRVAVSEEAAAFVARAGAGAVWAQVLELTRTTFPSARSIQAYLEDDPEIAGQRYLVCEVEVSDLDAAEGADAWEVWHSGLGALVPPTQIGLYRLSLELRD